MAQIQIRDEIAALEESKSNEDDNAPSVVFYILIVIQNIFTDSACFFPSTFKKSVWGSGSQHIDFNSLRSLDALSKIIRTHLLYLLPKDDCTDALTNQSIAENTKRGLNHIINQNLIKKLKKSPSRIAQNIYIFNFLFIYIYCVSYNGQKNAYIKLNIILCLITKELDIKEMEFKAILFTTLNTLNKKLISYYQELKLTKITKKFPEDDAKVPTVNSVQLTPIMSRILTLSDEIYSEKNKYNILSNKIESSEELVNSITSKIKKQISALLLISELYYMGTDEFIKHKRDDVEFDKINKILIEANYAKIYSREQNTGQFSEIFPSEYFEIEYNFVSLTQSLYRLDFNGLFNLTKKIIENFTKKRSQFRLMRWSQGYQSGNMIKIFLSFMDEFSPAFSSFIYSNKEAQETINVYSLQTSEKKTFICKNKPELEVISTRIRKMRTELNELSIQYSQEVNKYFEKVTNTITRAKLDLEEERLEQEKQDSLKKQAQGQREFADLKRNMLFEKSAQSSQSHEKFVLTDSIIPTLLSNIQEAREPTHLASLNDSLFFGDFWKSSRHSHWWVIKDNTPLRGRQTVALIQWFISFKILSIFCDIRRKNSSNLVLDQYSEFIQENQFIKYAHNSIFSPNEFPQWKQFNKLYDSNIENCDFILKEIYDDLYMQIKNKFNFKVKTH